jgi:hypothetical protein
MIGIFLSLTMMAGLPVHAVETAPRPWHGLLIDLSPDGQLLQVMWCDTGSVVTCWEREQRYVRQDGQLVLQPPTWTMTIRRGTGQRTLFDQAGDDVGHEDYRDGEYVGGAS